MRVNTWKLTIAYDGASFQGSQRQNGARTVQQEMERALEALGGSPVGAMFAGRTDSGVHAVGQVVSCPAVRSHLGDHEVQRALNAHLPADISVLRVERVPDGFHARYDARWREYRYRFWFGQEQPLLRNLVWVRRSDHRIDAMAEAAGLLRGTHDLASFAGGGEGVPWSDRVGTPRGTVRTISHCSVRPVASWWGGVPDSGYGAELRIVADGFLPRVVRGVAGALETIGAGREAPGWIVDLIERADRRVGPQTAPPQGLILWRVGYGDDVPDPEPDGGHEQKPGSAQTRIDIG